MKKDKKLTYKEIQAKKEETIRVKDFKALKECDFYEKNDVFGDFIGYEFNEGNTCTIFVNLEGVIHWIVEDEEFDTITHEEALEYTYKIIEMTQKGCFQHRGELSDGYHTFNELYDHRMYLFATVVSQNEEKSWKSWKHDDGTMYDNYFIVGIETPEGQFSYHYHKDHWNKFKCKELDNAPKWDGHEPKDITRLLSLVERGK